MFHLLSGWKFYSLLILIGGITIFYYILKRVYSYFDRNGFKTLPGVSYVFGHLGPTFIHKEPYDQLMLRLYNATTEPIIGLYGILNPILMVRDPKLIQLILVKEFSYFTDRRRSSMNDPRGSSLLFEVGQKWKKQRSIVLRSLTSGKLKDVFSTIINSGVKLQDHIEELYRKGDLFNVQSASACYTTNVMASFVLGIDVDTIKEPNCDFPPITTSRVITFCLYELAKNREYQDRVQNEIDNVLQNHNGTIDSDSILEMQFLQQCIYETLRKYPVATNIARHCVQDFRIPGTNQVIEKGTDLIIPVYGLHMDEQFYEDAKTFNPNRFNSDVGMNHVNRPFYPFGGGPRKCIGMRLGQMQVKVGLAMMLQKFTFHLKENNEEMTIHPKSFRITPGHGFELRISKR
ncbi:probable cytochrome P450 6d5 [Sitodiplosis mosellana]|uniref:probable cytochrome P450 6d5 n=1 Tax=Sitodiplosis mosellana TaxID=263140 RepID=UPI0024451CB7|nr:probable cytochrome P450 6d5 [Sitodiplosis mosellana]